MILITGATGLLGTHLVKYLLDKNNERLKLLIRKEPDKLKFPDSEKIEFVIGDVNDLTSLNEAFKNVKKVYHCAGFISFSPFDKGEMKKANIEGTANIVNCCLDFNIEKLCHVSSVSAIGKPKFSETANEGTGWDSSAENTYYGYTKYRGELEVWRGIEEGLNAVIINPSVILGPAEWHKSSMKIFDYVRKENKFYSNGGNNFVDVRDVVHVMETLMNSGVKNERFIVAGDRVLFKNLFEVIAKKLGVVPPSKEAKKWMASMLWRVEHLKALIFKTKPLLTKETAGIAERTHSYSSEKIKTRLKFSFRPVDETVSWIVEEIPAIKG